MGPLNHKSKKMGCVLNRQNKNIDNTGKGRFVLNLITILDFFQKSTARTLTLGLALLVGVAGSFLGGSFLGGCFLGDCFLGDCFLLRAPTGVSSLNLPTVSSLHPFSQRFSNPERLRSDSHALLSSESFDLIASDKIDFNRHIRPILSKYCTGCHGGVKQAAGVSFLFRESVIDAGILTPGDVDDSELFQRIIEEDEYLKMPPPDEHPEGLSTEEILIIRKWIEQGAQWGELWSLQPPRDDLAAFRQTSAWPQVDLDHFVLARLNQEELAPTPEASPSQWLRRVSFDLIGLPPSTEELNDFEHQLKSVSDRFNHGSRESHEAREMIYRGVVDRLLDSPQYGERWAVLWMDLARYSDSMGFEKDPHRDMWPYRDWLIQAFNDDMPFDDFTQKQLAGDMLPERTIDDWIATAFHRNTQTNDEGGTDDEEFRVAAVIDRVNTTWTVWMGTTFGCVQCHAHPYDPIRHDEYYQFMAFFNNTRDHDLSDDYPRIPIPTSSQERGQALQLWDRQQRLLEQIHQPGRSLSAVANWRSLMPVRAESTHGTLQINDSQVLAVSGTFTPGCQYTIQTDAVMATAIRLEILPQSDNPQQWPETGSVLSNIVIELVDQDGNGSPLNIARVVPDFEVGPYRAIDSLHDNPRGFGGYPKLHGPRWSVFVLEKPIPTTTETAIRFSLKQSATTSGNRGVHIRRLQLDYDDHPAWLDLNNDPHIAAWQSELADVDQEIAAIDGPKLPIMNERPNGGQRETRLFVRGNWMTKGERLEAGVPSALPSLDHDQPSRLQLAQWITGADNPLTARVLANRLWAALFGIGIVETQEDFGSSGALPTHPELLDHLAIQLQRHHRWHLKPFLRDLVLSSTYRQSHRCDQALYQRDPNNRLLARGPRNRLTAEMVRDQALAVSGLISRKMGGPSVMPPQPEGVWSTVYSDAQWNTPDGPDRYRRGVYTYWRRTSPYPSFLVFDAPSREFCSARREPTNTPLQALVTLNDPVYVESALALADRSLEAIRTSEQHQLPSSDPSNIAKAIEWGYRSVLQSEPSNVAVNELFSVYQLTLNELNDEIPMENELENESEQLHSVSDQAGESSTEEHCDQQQNPVESQQSRRALAVVMNTILNLDQALTK